jgi:hypothetical protein
MFEVPECLYAPVAKARSSARRMATAHAKGASAAEVAGPLVAITPERAGMIVLDRMWSSIPADAPQFHLDQPWTALHARCDLTTFARIASSAMQVGWAFAGLAGSQHYTVVRTAAAQLRFLDLARSYWPALVAVGRRFTKGSNNADSIEPHARLLHFCLARQGAPRLATGQLVPAPLEDHLSTLPGYRVRDLVAHGEIAAALELLRGHDAVTTCSLAEHLVVAGYDDEACRRVIELGVPDPHDIVAQWLAGRGDPARLVR